MKYVREHLEVPQQQANKTVDLKPLVDKISRQFDHFEQLFTKMSVQDNLRMEWWETTWTEGNSPFTIVPRTMHANEVKAVVVGQLLSSDFSQLASLGSAAVNWKLSADGTAISITEITSFSGGASYFVRLLLVGE